MNPITHFLTGWLVAESAPLRPRERAAVTIAAVIPDIDGLGYVPEWLTMDGPNRLRWYTDYHHELTHNLMFGVIVSASCFFISRYAQNSDLNKEYPQALVEEKVAASPRARPLLTAALAFLSVNSHFIGDVLGGRGGDGSQWPLPYFWPLSDWRWTWVGQWELNAWPNIAITVVALLTTFYLAAKRGYSPLGIFSERADRSFVQILRQRLAIDPSV